MKMPRCLHDMLLGAAHLMDFTGSLGPRLPKDVTVEEDMRAAWNDIWDVFDRPGC